MRVAAAGNSADPLDPGSVTGVATSIAAAAIWEPLVALTNDGIKLRLAESVTPNSTGNEWRIKLRPGKFHDGSAISPADALGSLKAIGASPNYSNAYEDVDFAKSSVEGDVVVLALRRPRADFIEGVLSQASPVIKGGDIKTKIGAGAFKYRSGDSQSGFVLDRFDDYFDGRPTLSGLEVRKIDDGPARLRAVEDGSIDFATDLPGTAKINKATPVDLGLGSAIAYTIELNTRIAPFDNPEVRKAVRLVLDRPRLVQLALGKPGIVGNDLIGVDLPGYAKLKQRERDLNHAKEIFARHQVTALELHSAELYAGMSKASEAMVQQFNEAGVKLTVNTVDAESYYNDMDALKARPMFVAYALNRPVAASLPLQTEATSTWNLNGFTTAAYQETLVNAMGAVDENNRATLYNTAQRTLHDQGASVIWGFKKRIDAAHSAVKGVSTVQGLPVFGKASLS